MAAFLLTSPSSPAEQLARKLSTHLGKKKRDTERALVNKGVGERGREGGREGGRDDIYILCKYAMFLYDPKP